LKKGGFGMAARRHGGMAADRKTTLAAAAPAGCGIQ